MRSLRLIGIATLAILWSSLPETQAQTIDETILNAMKASKEVAFDQGDDTVTVEMDIVYRKQDWENLQQLLKESSTAGGDLKKERRKKRKALRNTNTYWTDKNVPYYITPDTFSSNDLAQIQISMDEWEQYTCITFTERTAEPLYVKFVTGRGCSSYVGMVSRPQELTLAPGCRVKSVIVHEIGHAIGFHHEQTRPDRNTYVTINDDNIQSGMAHNFNRYSTSYINDYGLPYDYRSVMHYGSHAFSRNGQPTVVPTDPSYQNIIGRAQGLSFLDIKLANSMYECASHCGDVTCPAGGYVGKDCQCYCSGSPVQLCSDGPIEPTQAPSTQKPPTVCQDDHEHCESWASVGECSKNPNYMLYYCKKSCGVCNEDGYTCAVDNNPCDGQPGTCDFHFPHKESNKFVQCGVSGEICYEMNCVPGTRWSQDVCACRM